SGNHRIPTVHGHRKVEGRDDTGNTQRMPLLVHAVLGALRGHGFTVKHARLADGKITDIDHLLHFSQTFLVDLPHFVSHQPSQILFMVPTFQTYLPDNLPALGGRNHTPFTKSLLSFVDNLVVLLARG